jgi:hypothetical protein
MRRSRHNRASSQPSLRNTVHLGTPIDIERHQKSGTYKALELGVSGVELGDLGLDDDGTIIASGSHYCAFIRPIPGVIILGKVFNRVLGVLGRPGTERVVRER